MDANFKMAQNYGQLYQIKLMEDMLKTKSEENRKLIEALISTKDTKKSPA